MSIKEPFTDVEIETASTGFYEGYSLPIALISKVSMTALVLWALIWPLSADGQLNTWKWALLNGFNTFYVVAVGAFAIFLFIVAAIPSTGKKVLGPVGEGPEFSNFS